MSIQKAVLLVGLMIVLSTSLYTKTSSVVQLTAKDFDQVNKGIWLV